MKAIEKNVITGTVTSINSKLCSFVLDDNLIINIPHLVLGKKDLQTLPKIGENVTVSEHYHRSEELPRYIFLCEKSALHYEESVVDGNPCEDDLLEIIEQRKLGLNDLLNVYAVRKIIEERCEVSSVEDVIISILNVTQAATNMKLSLKTVSDCHYVDNIRKNYKYFPYWTFGVHRKKTSGNMLLGFLKLDKRIGLPFLKDINYRMPCCILLKNNEELLNIIGHLIIIKEYAVFTEIFNQGNFAPLEYLLFNIKDIIVLNGSSYVNQMIKFCVVEKPSENNFKYSFKFILQEKSNLTYIKDKNSSEFWLKVFNTSENRQEFLALSSSYVDIFMLFEAGTAYEIFHNEKLIPYFYKEIQRLENLPCRLFSEKSALFMKTELSIDTQLSLCTIDDERQILTTEEVQNAIKTSVKILSFQGIISAKEFVDPIESRTASNSVPVGFGTLGNKTHVLHFACNKETRLTLYLNNWECLQLPLGLIPDMRVLVRNVIPQKNVYLKSTVFTTFTVLGYEPKIKFCSMNLSKQFYGDGRISGLHFCSLLPNRVLVSVRINKIVIRSVKITCNGAAKFTTSLEFLVADHSGEAVVKSDRSSVLEVILQLKPEQKNKFLNAVKILGNFDYNLKEGGNLLHEVVRHTITIATSVTLRELELHCFNVGKKTDNCCGLPTLYCIGVRNIMTA